MLPKCSLERRRIAELYLQRQIFVRFQRDREQCALAVPKIGRLPEAIPLPVLCVKKAAGVRSMSGPGTGSCGFLYALDAG